jgi:hypothetical protein
MIKIKQLKEGVGTNQVNSLVPKILNVLERKIGKAIFYSAMPINFSNSEGFHSGSYALVEPDMALRLNWKIGAEHSNIESVDIWYGVHEIPDINIDVIGLNIVQIIDVIDKALKSKPTDILDGKVILESITGLREANYKIFVNKTPKGEYFLVGSGLPYDAVYCYENNPDIPLSKKDINELERANVVSYAKKNLHIETRTFKTEKEAWDFLSNIDKFEESIKLKEKDMPEPIVKRGRGRPRKGTTDKILMSQSEKDKILKSFKIPTSDKYKQIFSFIDLIQKGTSKGLIIAGRAGVGKSSQIFTYLKNKGIEYEYLSGSSTTVKEIYKFLFAYRDSEFILFDDFDDIINNKKMMDMLKAALDVNQQKKNTVTMLDKAFLDPQVYVKLSKNKKLNPFRYVANSFNFRSKLIIITNLDLNKINSAVLSRCLAVDMNISEQEVYNSIVANIDQFPPFEVEKKYKLEALKLLEPYVKDITNLDFRDYTKMVAILSTGAPNAKAWAMQAVLATK